MTLKKKKKKILTHSLHIPSKYNQQNNLNKFHIYKKPKKKSLPIGSSIQCKLWLFQKKIKKKKKFCINIYIYSSCHSLLQKKNLNSKKRILLTAEPCFNHCSSLVAILSNPVDISTAKPALWVMVSLSISPSLIVQCACSLLCIVYSLY